ncbi:MULTISPECIES: sensor histidine kinase [Mycobacteriaceae]|uniref:HAMP domain-containing histidine kinase n=1 Tax=Mycolicibacterium parafortuitum TaxID=39692 RepID=A0ACC6MCX5_MYCPF|nr:MULTISPECIES: HAMP domain-containing sensor histidine kinase [Mycobacteriaceae]MDZ5084814.1 HAMP domain-containing histidine kinase [Mycolicibacterium parafortuitum]GFM18600.1 signal transduction histidine kinase [Mycobacterium sp. PO1]GFM26515.1 signal transduction histidine kinase [Mycobacterium sp. PO2]
MSSNPRGEPRRAILRSLRSWSLRTRLLVTLIALLAVVCAAIGLATEFALQRFLTSQLDEQVLEAGYRSAVIFKFGPPPPPGSGPPERRALGSMPSPPPGFPPLGPPAPDRPQRGSPSSGPPEPVLLYPGGPSPGPRSPGAGPGPEFLNAPGQAAGTVGAVIADGRPLTAAVITADGARAEISAAAARQLAAVHDDGRPATVELDGLGRYRVIALQPDRLGQTVVTGIPTTDVDETMWWVTLIFAVVAAVALLAAAAAGVVIVRRQLAPLARVSAAAQQVADLELDRGEVSLPTPIVAVDPAAAHTEVGQLGAALNRMLDRIASALSARHASETRVRQFVADASHELRTPLAAIRGYTELAQRRHGDLPAEVAHAMDRVESETARMTRLVEDLLLLARLDAGRPLDRDPVDLTRLVVDAVSDAHVAGREHTWELDVPDESVLVDGDETRLHQVVANLLANARTHTPPGTSVTAALRVSDDGAVVLTVTDDGPGIDEKLLPEVFERFARGDTSRSRGGGSTGLGLAIADAVVRAHGGAIVVDSVAGRTEFAVTLPRHSQSAHSSASPGA